MSGAGWLGLDIGGANLKAAHSSGRARTLPFTVWKRPDDLPAVVRDLAGTFPAVDRLALTMTAELCDCFATKADGVRAVLTAVERALPGRRVRVWGIDGAFHDPAEVRERPLVAAAANWLALATLAARLMPEGPGLLVDIGTTTTDLIATRDGVPIPRGRTDSERLQTGELVYAGVVRTPVCALATELEWRGRPTGLTAELFASTLDVYLVRGELPEEPWSHDTADGRARTVAAARERLARMVGADREGFQLEDAEMLAAAADRALRERLVAAVRRVCEAVGTPGTAVVAGSGEFLARQVARQVVGAEGRVLELEEAWGPTASSAGCAHAVMVLAAESEGG